MLVFEAECQICNQKFLGIDKETVIEKYERHYIREHGNGHAEVSVEAVKRGATIRNIQPYDSKGWVEG